MSMSSREWTRRSGVVRRRVCDERNDHLLELADERCGGETRSGVEETDREGEGREEVIIRRVIYTVEVEITFTDDEMQSKEDLQGFYDYFVKPDCKDGWVRESVHDGNFVITGTRYEEEKSGLSRHDRSSS